MAPCVSVLTRQRRMGRTAAPLAGRRAGREERPGVGGELPVTRPEALQRTRTPRQRRSVPSWITATMGRGRSSSSGRAVTGGGHSPGRAKRAAGPQGIIRLGEAQGQEACDRAPSRGRTLGIVPTQADTSEGGEIIRRPGVGRGGDGARSPITLSPEAGRPVEGGSNADLGSRPALPRRPKARLHRPNW